MPCHFCNSSKHASENCVFFKTLRSRYSTLKLCHKFCLCENFVNKENATCKCKTFCDVCLQQHHIALCPKRDPNHPSYAKISDRDVIKLDVPILDRLFALSNPITKFKLQMTCKSLFNLPKTQYKLCNIFYWKNAKPNTICNGHGAINEKDDLRDLETKNIVFNLESFFIINRQISKSDLKILSKSDPTMVMIHRCKFDGDLSFREFVNAFPYCIDFSVADSNLPGLWIKDFAMVKRNVNIKRLRHKGSTNKLDYYHNLYYESLINLYKFNEGFKVTYNFDYSEKIYETFRRRLLSFKAISPADEKSWNFKFGIKYGNQHEIHYFKFDPEKAKITSFPFLIRSMRPP